MRSVFLAACLLFACPALAADMELIKATKVEVFTDTHGGRHIFKLPTLRARIELAQLCYEIKDNPLGAARCEKEAQGVRNKWLDVVEVLDFLYGSAYRNLSPLERVERARVLVNEAEKAQAAFLDEYFPY